MAQKSIFKTRVSCLKRSQVHQGKVNAGSIFDEWQLPESKDENSRMVRLNVPVRIDHCPCCELPLIALISSRTRNVDQWIRLPAGVKARQQVCGCNSGRTSETSQVFDHLTSASFKLTSHQHAIMLVALFLQQVSVRLNSIVSAHLHMTVAADQSTPKSRIVERTNGYRPVEIWVKEKRKEKREKMDTDQLWPIRRRR